MPAEPGQPDCRSQLAHEQINDQQAPGRGGLDAADPRLRTLAQAMPFQQADYGERQKDDQRNVARLDKTSADFGEDFLNRKMRGQPGNDRGDCHDQHRIEPQ